MPDGQHAARGGAGVALILLDDPVEAARRRALLTEPHIAPIDGWARRLADHRPVPHPDPLDGGVAARLLILLETPSAGPTPLRFVSRDNATPTARNLRRFLDGAGLSRRDTVLWNVVPWIVHAPGERNRPVRAAELRAGLETVPELLALLPRLRVVVLAGRKADAARPSVATARPTLPVLAMPHPSPTSVCTSPTVGERIAATLARAAALVGDPAPPR